MLKISYFKNFLTTSSLKSLNMSHIIYKIPRMTVVSKETVLKSKNNNLNSTAYSEGEVIISGTI